MAPLWSREGALSRDTAGRGVLCPAARSFRAGGPVGARGAEARARGCHGNAPAAAALLPLPAAAAGPRRARWVPEAGPCSASLRPVLCCEPARVRPLRARAPSRPGPHRLGALSSPASDGYGQAGTLPPAGLGRAGSGRAAPRRAVPGGGGHRWSALH